MRSASVVPPNAVTFVVYIATLFPDQSSTFVDPTASESAFELVAFSIIGL